MLFKIVDTLTVVESDDGRKNTTIINTSASASMSQINPVLNHFPPVDMGVPLLYTQAIEAHPMNIHLLDSFLALL